MRHRHLVLAAVAALAPTTASAQCAAPPIWSPAVSSTEVVDALLPDGLGGLYAGGSFLAIGGTPAACIARFDGATWSPLGSGMAGGITAVHALLRTGNGDLIAAGSFTTAGGTPAAHIARWNGSSWSALGSGIGGFGVFRLAAMPNGDVIALGNFTSAGGVPANNIARWNGSAWSALGSGMFSPGGMLVRQNGELIAGGSFAGTFDTVARWTGSTWAPLGSFASMVPNGFAELRNGDLLAAGYQTVQRFDGTTWTNVGTLGGTNLTTGYDIAALADGSALVVGSFATITAGGVTSARGVARYEPATSSWSDFGSIAALAPIGQAGRIGRAVARADGSVLLHQVPALSGGTATSAVAIAPGCPATAVPIGTGCAGNGGLDVLTAPSLPWLGTAVTGTGTGVPAGAIAIGVFGLSTVNLPLDSVLPGALPGCTGRVFPDLLTVHAANGGAVTASLALPLDPTLSGLPAWLQMVALEAGGAVTASNALAFVFGRL